MFVPALLPRMEQRHFFPLQLIESGKTVAFAQIACTAGQAQIPIVVHTAA